MCVRETEKESRELERGEKRQKHRFRERERGNRQIVKKRVREEVCESQGDE